MLKKFINFTTIGIIAIISISMHVKATTLNVDAKAKNILIEYFDAIKDKNIDKAIELSTNTLIKSKENQKQNLIDILSNPNKQLKSFEILTNLESNENTKVFKAKLQYRNNKVIELPMKVKNIDGNLKVLIGVCNNIKELEAGKEIPVRTKRTQVATWEGSLGQYDPYLYSTKFSCNTNYVQLNYKQKCTANFRIVDWLPWGLDKVSYEAQRGSNWDSGPNQVTLNLIPGKKFKDVRLWITYVDGGYTFGEVYAY